MFTSNVYQFVKDRFRSRRGVKMAALLGISADSNRFVEWNIKLDEPDMQDTAGEAEMNS